MNAQLEKLLKDIKLAQDEIMSEAERIAGNGDDYVTIKQLESILRNLEDVKKLAEKY